MARCTFAVPGGIPADLNLVTYRPQAKKQSTPQQHMLRERGHIAI